MKGAPKDGDTQVFEEICKEAASCGHLEILKWARERGCPWHEVKNKACFDAVVNGHLEIIKYAHENGWIGDG